MYGVYGTCSLSAFYLLANVRMSAASQLVIDMAARQISYDGDMNGMRDDGDDDDDNGDDCVDDDDASDVAYCDGADIDDDNSGSRVV